MVTRSTDKVCAAWVTARQHYQWISFLFLARAGEPRPYSYLVFLLLSFYHVLLLRKSTKTPGTRKFQSTSFLFKSRKRHLSVKEVLPLELPACFLGAAGLLQLATRQSERLTSSQTGLALFPKNNQVQAVEFNGAGYHWNYRC